MQRREKSNSESHRDVTLRLQTVSNSSTGGRFCLRAQILTSSRGKLLRRTTTIATVTRLDSAPLDDATEWYARGLRHERTHRLPPPLPPPPRRCRRSSRPVRLVSARRYTDCSILNTQGRLLNMAVAAAPLSFAFAVRGATHTRSYTTDAL